MEEREMLELAALAAGLEVEWNACSGFFEYIPKGQRGYVRWRPHSDDGDSMRLAVDAKISFGISKQTGRPLVCWFVNNELRKSEMHKDPDPPQYAASRVEWVRAAIFYAATDIGRTMREIDKVKKVHINPDLRKCHLPDCRKCDGTGLDKFGFTCLMQGDIPF